MTPFDLTLLLLISNSVQNAMTGPDTSLLGGVAAAITLLVLNYLIAEVSGGNRRFRKLVEGQPSLLVHDGEVITAHMAREHVSMDELDRALREHGISSCNDVALAVLEVDGSISCRSMTTSVPRPIIISPNAGKSCKNISKSHFPVKRSLLVLPASLLLPW